MFKIGEKVKLKNTKLNQDYKEYKSKTGVVIDYQNSKLQKMQYVRVRWEGAESSIYVDLRADRFESI